MKKRGSIYRVAADLTLFFSLNQFHSELRHVSVRAPCMISATGGSFPKGLLSADSGLMNERDYARMAIIPLQAKKNISESGH